MEKMVPSKVILVVDDDHAMRSTLVNILTDKGYKAFEAKGGYQALEILKDESIDLVISDIQMPDGDGFELARALRASPNFPPLIFMSGGLGLTESDLRTLGASFFLSKPVAVRDILKAIQTIFETAA